jgi:hypothetical protein
MMFYAMWLVCIMGATPECREIERKAKVLHKTEEACLEDALQQTRNIIEYLTANGLQGQVGHKCVEDKNSI